MNVTDVVEQVHNNNYEEAKKLLGKRAMNEVELAEEMKVSRAEVRRIFRELKKSGANFIENDGKFMLHGLLEHGGHLVLRPKDRGDGWTVFGFVTDKHLCNTSEEHTSELQSR